MPFSHFGDHAPSQAVKDALADYETFLLNDSGSNWSTWYAGYYGTLASECPDSPDVARYNAASAAHSAFCSVPGLRG